MKRLILLFLLALAALPVGLVSARDRVASGGQLPPPPPPPPPPREVADPVPPTTGDLARVYALSCLWLARLWVLRHLAELGALALVAGLVGALRLLRRRTVRAAALALVLAALLPGAAARATEPIENHEQIAPQGEPGEKKPPPPPLPVEPEPRTGPTGEQPPPPLPSAPLTPGLGDLVCMAAQYEWSAVGRLAAEAAPVGALRPVVLGLVGTPQPEARPASEAGPDPDRPTFEPKESPVQTGPELSPLPKAKHRMQVIGFVVTALLLGLFVWWRRDDL